MTVKRLLTVATIIGFLASCEGQPMRKRLISPVIKIENLEPFSNANANAISLDFDVKANKGEQQINGGGQEEKTNFEKRAMFKAGKVMGRNGSEKKSDVVSIENYFTNMLRMDGVQMSMSSPPASTPTKKPSDGGNPPVVAPTRSPTLKPTRAGSPDQGCESLSREEALKETLERVTAASILDNFDTPQGKAFAWLLGRDMAQIDPCNDAIVEQRYALATFFYSTNGSKWRNKDGWITDVDECSWNGIKCNGNGLVQELGANGALSE